MPNVKAVPGTAKKAAAKRATKPSAKSATPRKPRSKAAAKAGPREPEHAAVEPGAESISEAQAQVVASKFVGVDTGKARPAPRRPPTLPPTLPTTYGESHLLLLVRDPQTLFAAWDMAPATLDSLKARMGSRAFAVSTLTLRLIPSEGNPSSVHLGKKARSRYLKVEGGPSFVAEIGFTSPTGRFELIARSEPCFVPMGVVARPEAAPASRRAMLGYRAARAQARRDLAAGGGTARTRAMQLKDGRSATSASGSAVRVLGGASDLYRR